LAVGGELYVNDIDFSAKFDDDALADHSSWEMDPERRMQRAFAAITRKAESDHAFSIEFFYDEAEYRTAVRVKRTSAAPVRFTPVVGYGPLVDNFGRPVYRITDTSHKMDPIAE